MQIDSRAYQICVRCVMDTSDEDIRFNEQGVCHHCRDFEEVLKQPRYDKVKAPAALEALIKRVKETSADRSYDCIVGISGGVDSCYTAYLCHSWGLRPLLLHMDNGWNSDISVSNIKNLIDLLLRNT